MRFALIIAMGFATGVLAQDGEMAGTAVSRPLQPVQVPLDVPPPASPPVAEAVEVCPCTPKSWSSYELLLWWSKTQPIPDLVIGTNAVQSVRLVGGDSLGEGMYTGFRFTMGWNVLTVNDEQKLGFEFSGLFLGTRVNSAAFSDTAPSRFSALARPYIDAATGQPSALLISGPGVGTGAVEVATTTRVQGWEVNLVRTLVDCGEVAVTAIGGYRQLTANEGLSIRQTTLRIPVAGQPPIALWSIYDQFDGRNNFHGGQIGMSINGTTGRWLFKLSGKIALGANFQTVNITGNSSVTTAALPVPAVQPFASGFLAAPSNTGRHLQSMLTYVPEARLNVGYRVGESCHVMVGYDFLYLSSAVRPGDQVDAMIDASRSPVLNAGATLGGNRPGVPFARSDFWVQGLMLGLDCRY